MTDQSTIRRFGPKRFIGEALSVTAGVLLAFSVDAGWSRVQEAEVVERLRAAAQVEAAANRVQLERAETTGAGALAAAQYLTVLIRPQPEPLSPDSLGRIVGTMLSYGRAPLDFSATDRLLSAGELDVLREGDFQVRLLRYRSAATQYQDQARRFDQVHEAFVQQFYAVAPGGWLSANRGIHSRSDFPVDVAEVLGSAAVEGAVGNLAIWIDNLNWRVDQLLLLSDSVWSRP